MQSMSNKIIIRVPRRVLDQALMYAICLQQRSDHLGNNAGTRFPSHELSEFIQVRELLEKGADVIELTNAPPTIGEQPLPVVMPPDQSTDQNIQ